MARHLPVALLQAAVQALLQPRRPHGRLGLALAARRPAAALGSRNLLETHRIAYVRAHRLPRQRHHLESGPGRAPGGCRPVFHVPHPLRPGAPSKGDGPLAVRQEGEES